MAQTDATSSAACNNSPLLCDRRYNEITHLGAHDSPFISESDNGWSLSGNQFYNSTAQLSAGVRVLTAQVHYVSESGEWHVCHSSCALLDAGTLSSWLANVSNWMDANVNEVVTLLLVNSDAATASDLAAQYTSSGISKYTYTPTFSSATTQWPTLSGLIGDGTRLVSFVPGLTSNAGAEYLLDEWTYIFENPYDNFNDGNCVGNYSCIADRPGTSTASYLDQGMMPLLNHFLYQSQSFGIETPNASCAPVVNAPGNNSGNLGLTANTCARSWERNPWGILVDFFNVGPAIDTVDSLNGVTDPVGRISISTAVLSEQTEQTNAAVGLSIYGFVWLSVLANGLYVLLGSI